MADEITNGNNKKDLYPEEEKKIKKKQIQK